MGVNPRLQLNWGLRVPMRDGIHLHATLYLPKSLVKPSPAIFTMTPYVAQSYHDRGLFFAGHGYPFLAIDVRGRGNSEGIFNPNINEAKDGYDIVEWLAQQPYCNGQVAMWGGSYSGYAQWATAKEFPPHLATIVPVAAPYLGVDFPMRGNIAFTYVVQWLTLVWGCTSQEKLFSDERYWAERFRYWFESGTPFKELDAQLGAPSETFQEWLSHPEQDAYWDRYNPTAEQYEKLSLPILTITGIYDSDQPGALTHYCEHLGNAAPEARSRHYLIIGPWDHGGTRTPTTEFCGLTVGAESLIDLGRLHLEWYAWTMQGQEKPEFLKKNIAYYVMGAERWRYADTLEAITARSVPFYLGSRDNPLDVFHSGMLTADSPGGGGPDFYHYDPLDTGAAQLESTLSPVIQTDQRMTYVAVGKQLVYHSVPFEQDTEVSGFFKFIAWLSIDQPDADFTVRVYDIALDGSAVQLTSDVMRARYRKSLREANLIRTTEPQCYEFERFTFVSRELKRGHRLRLVFGPLNSIYYQKNYNSGGAISEETRQDARPVNVKLFHDRLRPSALYVPFAVTHEFL